jgi:hypothetical protein
MANYFDYTQAGDKNLLLPAQRTNADLVNVAAEAEKDVIEQYTERAHYSWYTARLSLNAELAPEPVNTNLGLYVFLRGYKQNAADPAVDPDLKDALKREIADVISWRFRQRDVNTLTTSESDGAGKSVSLRPDSNATFPRGFGRRLRRFDIREPVWGS